MRFKTSTSQRGQPDRFTDGLAFCLGCFSILLGIIELAAMRPLTRGLGLEGYDWIIPVYAVREILAGTLIFVSKDSTPWIWFRVCGDVLDIATVMFGYKRHMAAERNFVITFVALAGATALDLYCAMRLTSDSKLPMPSMKPTQINVEFKKP